MKLKFNINLNVVKSKNNLEIARKYHYYDNVESMHITLKDDLYHIDAIVSVFNHMQKCSLEIKDNKVVSYSCSCPFNDEDSMCGHLGAVIMKLNELEINDFPFDYQSEKLEKMKEIIAEQLGVEEDEITPDTSFKEDLGADSLDLFELTMALEEEYDTEIPAEELEDIETVGDVIEYLREKGIDE